MLIGKEDVMKFIPHRDPFLFIDSVESVIQNEKELPMGNTIEKKELAGIEITANFFTRENLEIFKGHFPGNPILPGVIQIEMMAQACCFGMLVCLDDPLSHTLDVAFMSVNDVKFRKPVLPNTQLTIKANCKKVRGAIMTYDCKLYHKDVLVSEASMFASLKA